MGAAADTHRSERTRLEKALRVEKDTVAALAQEIEIRSQEVNRLMREIELLKNARAELAEQQAISNIWSIGAPLSTRIAWFSPQAIGTLLVVSMLSLIAFCGHYRLIAGELKERRITMKQLEAELDAEVSGMLKVGESGDGLGFDFGFQVLDIDLQGRWSGASKFNALALIMRT